MSQIECYEPSTAWWHEPAAERMMRDERCVRREKRNLSASTVTTTTVTEVTPSHMCINSCCCQSYKCGVSPGVQCNIRHTNTHTLSWGMCLWRGVHSPLNTHPYICLKTLLYKLLTLIRFRPAMDWATCSGVHHVLKPLSLGVPW